MTQISGPYCPLTVLNQYGDYQVLTPENTHGGVKTPQVRMYSDFEIETRWRHCNPRLSDRSLNQVVSYPVEKPIIKRFTLDALSQEIKKNLDWMKHLSKQRKQAAGSIYFFYDANNEGMRYASRGMEKGAEAAAALLKAIFSRMK